MTKFLVPSLSVLVLITSLDIIYHFPKSTSEVTSFRAYPSNPRKDDISCFLGLLIFKSWNQSFSPSRDVSRFCEIKSCPALVCICFFKYKFKGMQLGRGRELSIQGLKTCENSENR